MVSPGVRLPTDGAARASLRLGVWVLCLLALGVGGSAPAFAGPIDPRLRFAHIDTPHFTIYFHEGEEALSSHLAAIAEDVRSRVGASLQTSLPLRTHVILADQSEFANGYATPLPRDTIFLNATAPSGAEFIGNADDWLRVLFTHEYTHIVHLDRSRGWSTIARHVFGRAPFAFPNLTLPQWQIEGLATWQEGVSTGFGRGTAGDFRAIETTAAAGGPPLTLDQSSGGLVSWPDGNAQYVAGLGFHQYLANRFGAESLGRLSDATAGRPPYLGTRAFRRIYGENLGTLWNNYSDEVTRRAASADISARGSQLTRFRSAAITGPRFAPAGDCADCQEHIIYSVESADALPELREVHADGSGDRRLATRYLGSTIGITATSVVFDQLELHRAVGLYADLYVLNRPSGAVRRLTSEARLQDPDISPDGQRIVATQQHGDRRDLVMLNVALEGSDQQQTNVVVVASNAFTSFSAPRWSPSGRFIAAERRRAGALPDVVVLDAESKGIVSTLSDPNARIVTPTWRPDERAIIAAATFDEQRFDLYEFALDAPHVRRLTRTTGALWPDVSSDGRLLAYAGYTAQGFALFTTPYSPEADERASAGITSSSTSASPANPDAASTVRLDAHDYSPVATLVPTSWTPVLYDDTNGTRVGGALSSADVLGRHAYALEATWLVDGPGVERAPSRAAADWSASYAYTRWQPTVFAAASRNTSAVLVARADGHSTTTVAMVERQAQAGVVLPVPHVLRRTQWLASVLRTDRQYLFAENTRNVRLMSARLALAHSSARQYGYSISPEHGVAVGTTLEVASRALGSQSNATTATVDARLYAPGLARHHVLAVRGAAGVSNGAALARQSFRLGATGASSSVIDFGTDALGLLRGMGGATVAGRQVVVANGEYRVPLLRLERGHGTWPLFVRFIHAAVFVDAGRVRGIADTSTQWRHAEGAELSVAAVAGYALPITVSVGAAWMHDGAAAHGPTAYVRLGHAF